MKTRSGYGYATGLALYDAVTTVDTVVASIPAHEIDRGDYIIFFAADVGTSNTTGVITVKHKTNGGSAVAFAAYEAHSATPSMRQFKRAETAIRVTLDGTNDVELLVVGTAGWNVCVTNAQIIALRVGDLVEGKDFWWARDETDTQHTTTMAKRAAVNVEERNGEHYMVVSGIEVQIDTLTPSWEAEPRRDGTTIYPLARGLGEDLTEVHTAGFVNHRAPTADDGEVEYAIYSRDDAATAANDHQASWVFVLRLNATAVESGAWDTDLWNEENATWGWVCWYWAFNYVYISNQRRPVGHPEPVRYTSFLGLALYTLSANWDEMGLGRMSRQNYGHQIFRYGTSQTSGFFLKYPEPTPYHDTTGGTGTGRPALLFINAQDDYPCHLYMFNNTVGIGSFAGCASGVFSHGTRLSDYWRFDRNQSTAVAFWETG